MTDYIDRIVETGNTEDMKCLKDIFTSLMENLKDTNPDKYEKYTIKLKGIAYNYEVDSDLAKDIVSNMKPLGEYWSIDTISNVIGNDNHRLEDMYVVMNSLANDYKDILSLDDTDTYIRMAHAWLDDEDGKEHKLWKYFISE